MKTRTTKIEGQSTPSVKEPVPASSRDRGSTSPSSQSEPVESHFSTPRTGGHAHAAPGTSAEDGQALSRTEPQSLASEATLAGGHTPLVHSKDDSQSSDPAISHTQCSKSQSRTQSDTQPHSWIPQELIGLCALLLMAQFLAQLLLIPQGTLFGQLMFVATLCTSWLYNSALSSMNREEIQTGILLDVLKIDEKKHIQKFAFNNWTETVAFTSLVLDCSHHIRAPSALLDRLLPNDTVVWRAWKEAMAKKLESGALLEGENPDAGFDWKYVKDDDKSLLETFFTDANAARDAWVRVRPDVKRMVEPPKESGDGIGREAAAEWKLCACGRRRVLSN